MRYVDDTFVIIREDQKQSFLDHINNIDPAIKFTEVKVKVMHLCSTFQMGYALPNVLYM